MITINKDRTAYIPESDRHIGFENDNLVETRCFEITDEETANFSFKLDIADTLDIIDLEKVTLDDGKCVLLWKITAAAIGDGGIIKAQLRAFDSTGEKVWHSQIMEFVADSSVNAEKQIDDERIISEFEQLEATTTNAVNQSREHANSAYTYSVVATSAKETAQLYAEDAQKSTSAAKEHALAAEGYAISVAEAKSYVESEITRFENNYGNAEKLYEKVESHYQSTDNPHSVTASQVGAYSKAETDELIGTVLETEEFAWTDYFYMADGEVGIFAEVEANKITIDGAHGSEYMTIACRGDILGFSFSISGYSDAKIRINDEIRTYPNPKKDGSVFATDTFPLTKLNRSIYLDGDENTWTFTDMKRASVMGVAELEERVDKLEDSVGGSDGNIVIDTELNASSGNAIANSAVAKAIGDIDTALDGIIAIQNGLIGN